MMMLVPDSDDSHIRPRESTSMVAISLPESVMEVAVGRTDQSRDVFRLGTYSSEMSCGEVLWRRRWVRWSIVLGSGGAVVLEERRSTFVHWCVGSSRHSQVPDGLTAVLGRTAHQWPAWNQSFDCGFSPVVCET